jgi:hypothetical protein
MTPLETLKAARQLISDPAKWTQRFKALDEFALPVDPKSERAICFCALGAMQNVTGLSRYHRPVFDAAEVLNRKLPLYVTLSDDEADFTDYNDTHTHAEVLALFDAAIAELEGVR